MEKREFVQRFLIERYEPNNNVYHTINTAVEIYDMIEESLQPKAVDSTNLWSPREP